MFNIFSSTQDIISNLAAENDKKKKKKTANPTQQYASFVKTAEPTQNVTPQVDYTGIPGYNKPTIPKNITGGKSNAYIDNPDTVAQIQQDKISAVKSVPFSNEELVYLNDAKKKGLTKDQAYGEVYKMRQEAEKQPQKRGGGIKRGLPDSEVNPNEAKYNPIGYGAELLDNAAQSIPTIDVKKGVSEEIDQKVANLPPEEIKRKTDKFNNSKSLQKLYGNVDTYIRETSKSYMQGLREDFGSVFNLFANTPASAVKTATATLRGVTNPLDTIKGLYNLAATPEGRQALVDRYGSMDNVLKTMETDPVGLASDVLTIIQGGGNLVKYGAKGTTIGAKAGRIAEIAGEAADLGISSAVPKGFDLAKSSVKGNSAIAKTIRLGIDVAEAPTAPLKTLGKIQRALPEGFDFKKPDEVLYEKSVKPTVQGKKEGNQYEQYKKDSMEAVDIIASRKDKLQFQKDNGDIETGRAPKNLAEFSDSIDQTKKDIWDEATRVRKAAGGDETLDYNPVIKELQTLGKDVDSLELVSPGLGKYIESQIQNVTNIINKGGHTFDEAQKLILQPLNQKLKTFYQNPNPNDIGKNMVDVLISNTIKNAMDEKVIGTLGGSNVYRDLLGQYSKLKKIEKDVKHRAIVDSRKNPKGFFDITDIFTAGELIQAFATLNPAQMAKAGGMFAVKNWVKFLNDPNNMVNSLFKRRIKKTEPYNRSNIGKLENYASLGRKAIGMKMSEVTPEGVVKQEVVIPPKKVISKQTVSELDKRADKNKNPQSEAKYKEDLAKKNIEEEKKKVIAKKQSDFQSIKNNPEYTPRDVNGYRDVNKPQIGDITEQGKVTAVKEMGGQYNQFRVQIEGKSEWMNPEYIGGVYGKKPEGYKSFDDMIKETTTREEDPLTKVARGGKKEYYIQSLKDYGVDVNKITSNTDRQKIMDMINARDHDKQRDLMKDIIEKYGDDESKKLFARNPLLGDKITNEQAKKIVNKYFDESEVSIIFRDQILTPEGQKALGAYSDRMIEFAKNPNKGVPEHEVVHAYIDLFKTKEQKSALLEEVLKKQDKAVKEIMKETGITDKYEAAEEYIADNFIKYVQGKATFTGKIRNFFRSLRENIKKVFGRGDNVRQLYEEITGRVRPETPKKTLGVNKRIFSAEERFAIEENKNDVSIKFLEDITKQVKDSVGKQFLENYGKKPDLKNSEKNIIQAILLDMPDKMSKDDFIKRVKSELLELKTFMSELDTKVMTEE